MQLPGMNSDFIQRIRDFAAQGLLQRTAVYTVLLLISAILTVAIFGFFHWPMVLAYELALIMLFFGFGVIYLDPEAEYTNEDVFAIYLSAAFMVFIVYFMHTTGTALGQIASPLIQLQTAGQTVAQQMAAGATSPAIGSLSWFLAEFFMYLGVMFGGFGWAHIVRTE